MSTSKIQKLFCYVDESGQDTKGEIFIVSVVVTGKERDELRKACEKFEKDSGKGNHKWRKSRHKARFEYLQKVLSHPVAKGALRYSVFRQTTDYEIATVMGIAKAVNVHKPKGRYTTLIYVDALQKSQRFIYGRELRKLGIPTRKVQGVAREKSNPMTRLADAIAGFVRANLAGRADQELRALFARAKRKKVLVEV